MDAEDLAFMERALDLARQAEALGEVPVGAVLVRDGGILGEGFNRPIGLQDPTAHAEIQALRDAGRRLGNYRFPGSVLYCTLEPCVMCAGALIHARVSQVIYGAPDPRGGACGGALNLLPSGPPFNHRVECRGEIQAGPCGEILRAFFRRRRGSASNQG